MTKASMTELGKSGDLITSCTELWSMDDIRFLAGGVAAVVTAKSHQTYTFKGTPHDDITNKEYDFN